MATSDTITRSVNPDPHVARLSQVSTCGLLVLKSCTFTIAAALTVKLVCHGLVGASTHTEWGWATHGVAIEVTSLTNGSSWACRRDDTRLLPGSASHAHSTTSKVKNAAHPRLIAHLLVIQRPTLYRLSITCEGKSLNVTQQGFKAQIRIRNMTVIQDFLILRTTTHLNEMDRSSAWD